MQTSLAWLNSYLDQPCDAAEAQQALTDVGFPVEDQAAVTTTAGQSDTALDVEITSNRSDCLSHLGLAREVSAATGRALVGPDCQWPAEQGEPVEQVTRVANDAPELCPVYTARVVRGVNVGPSPAWLADRLEAIGLRPINNVVDVTNYVLFELGQPLHAFDLNALHEQRIIVRQAKQGEPFTAIDGSAHKLSDSMLVIADADRPVAVAGVMGGAETEVGDATTDILLESAIFDPLSVRRTSRALKLASDSSYRYERGVDPLGVEQASRRAAALIQQLAGGEIAEGVLREGANEPESRRVSVRVDRANQLLGLDLTGDEQSQYLDRLGLSPHATDGAIDCTIPPRRLDLHREVDLIEEIARLHGLDQVPVQPKIHLVARARQRPVAARQTLGQALAGRGYHETITFSFLEPQQGQPFLPEGASPATVEQERLRAQSMLRPAVTPSLLICRKANQDLGNRDVRLYECGACWDQREGQIVEREHLALLADAEDPQQALRDMRGTIEELIEQLGGQKCRAQCHVEPIEDARYASAGRFVLDGDTLGHFGLLSQAMQERFDLQTPVVVAELELATLIDLYPPTRTVGKLPRYPGIERDLSIVVGENTPWQQVDRTIAAAEPALLEAVTFLDTYRGKPIPKGQKSVSFRMRFRDPSRTLRHEEVDPQVQSVIDALKSETSAELRG
jgi:phenylalanyl-tRNA synthetase beta chain